jgi:hypothetical protein
MTLPNWYGGAEWQMRSGAVLGAGCGLFIVVVIGGERLQNPYSVASALNGAMWGFLRLLRPESSRPRPRPSGAMITSDARLWHPWLRINRVLRVMLHTRWSAEAWPQVKAEFTKALALRSQIRRAGWFS